MALLTVVAVKTVLDLAFVFRHGRTASKAMIALSALSIVEYGAVGVYAVLHRQVIHTVADAPGIDRLDSEALEMPLFMSAALIAFHLHAIHYQLKKLDGSVRI